MKDEFPAAPAASHFVEMQPMSSEEINAFKDMSQLQKDHDRMTAFAKALSDLSAHEKVQRVDG